MIPRTLTAEELAELRRKAENAKKGTAYDRSVYDYSLLGAAPALIAQAERAIRYEKALHDISGQPCMWEAGEKTHPCRGDRTDCDPCLARAALVKETP